MKKAVQHKMFICLIVTVIIAVCLVIGLYTSKYCLVVSYYQISTSRVSSSVRIVQISDLHNSEFGASNEELVKKVADQSPDLILITGDLINSSEESTDIAQNLISKLSEICSVYVSLGNHEIEYEEKYDFDLTSLYENAGATVLDKAYDDIIINEQVIRLGGIYGYCVPAKYLESGEGNEVECEFLADFQDTDLYTILMCHIPVCWFENEGLDEWDVDCVFSGHVHGGQVIIPFVGGLYAPDYGWFPGKLEGLYYSSDKSKVTILSRGLGSTEKIPRMNNVPEIVVVDIVPQQ